jgi:sugar/nucleoside kinase (ribokinase family)
MLKRSHYDVICLGQALVDIFANGIPNNITFNGDRIEPDIIEIAPGGDAYNQASLLARYGCTTALIAPIGGSGIELQVFDTSSGNLDLQSLDPDSCRTSKSIVLIQENGERKIITNIPGKPETLQFNFDNIQSVAFLSYASFFGIPWLDDVCLEAFDRARSLGATIIADTTGGGIDRQKSLDGIYGHLDYFVPSYEEARFISGETDVEKIAAYFQDHGCRNIILKLGKKGCYFQNAEMKESIPTYDYGEVKDTCGAGDTFVSSFIYGLNKSWSISESLRFANAAASICVTRYGASGNVESVEQVNRVMTESSKLIT